MAAKPIQEGRKVSITADEAANLLKNADLKLCIKEPPACPLDGQIFIFKPSNPRSPDGWKDDGFMWRIISSSQQPRRNPRVLKRVYVLQLPDNTVCRDLRKEVYCSCKDDDERKLTLLHYLGKFEYAESIEEVQQSATIGTQEEMELGNSNAVYVVQEDSMPEFPETVIQGAIPEQASVENAESNVSEGGMIPNPEQSSDAVVSCESHLSECLQEDAEAGITSSSEPSASPEQKRVNAQVSSSSTKQAADSSTGSEDIEMALKTLQSALQKKLGSKPVMDMVSKLVESVTSTEENADIDYCLVVSDKKSGKSSVIGTPEIASRVTRRIPGGGDSSDQDEDIISSKIAVKTRGKAKTPVVVKQEKTPSQPAKQIPSVTELGEYDILTASGDIIHFPEPTSETVFSSKIVSEEEKIVNSDFFEDSRRRSKNVEKYLKIRNHIIQTWQKQKPTYLTKSRARKGLKDCGDVTPISRIHTYLECKGVINFNAVRDTSRPWLRKGRSEPDQTNSPKSKRRKITSLGGQDSDEEADSDLDPDNDEEDITKEKVEEKSTRKRARTESSQQSEGTETPGKRTAAAGKQSNDSKNKTITQEKTKSPLSSPFKTPSAKGVSEDVVSVRTSSLRTRNVATPNWADIMSGKKSFKKDGAVLVHVKSEQVSDEEESMDVEKSPSKKPEAPYKKSPVKKGKAKSLNKEITGKEDTMDIDDSETNECQEVTIEIVRDVIEVCKKPLKDNTGRQAVKEEKKSLELKKRSKNPVKDNTGGQDVKEEKKSLEQKKTIGDKEISSPENTNIPKSSPQIAYKYACSECDKSFNVSQHLEDHMKKVHSKAVDGVDTEDEAAVEDMEGDEDDDYADELDIIGYDDEFEDPDFNASGSDADVDNGDNDSNYMREATKKKRSTEERTTFSDDELEDKVMGTLTPGQKPTCKICGLVFLSKPNLKKHTLLHTNKMYECPFCAKLMKRKDYVKHHIRKVHKEHDIEKNPIDFDKYTHIVEPEVNVKEEENENENCNDGKEAPKRCKPSKMKVIAGIGKKVCPECNKLFDIQEELEAHMVETHKKELKDAAYTCQACKKQFKTLVSFQVHKLSHRKKDHVCSHCGKKFSNNSQLQVHRRNDHQIQYGTLMYFGYLINEGKLACEICTTDFENVDEFHKHRPTHIIYENLCTKCGNGFPDSEELEKHIKSDCSEVNLHLKCGVCDQKFSMYDSRRKHVLTNHPKTTDFFCHHCGICFENMAALTDHFPIHKEEKIFICEYCGKRFFEKRNLVDHRELHRSSKNWQCHICDKYYISSKSLQRHIKLHLRNKFKACKYCPSKFGTAEELEEHTLKEHLDEESGNTCRVCEKSFLDKDRLVKHMQIHADNMYTCEVCDGTFDAVQEPVWKHMKKAHPVEASCKSKRTFQCDLCDFTAPAKNRLERHMETHNAGKEFECRYCGRLYKTTSSLFTHMIIHRGKVKKGAKPQPICTWTRCNKQYTKHSLYKRHLISHIFRVKVGKDLCECGQCVYSTPQVGQTFFVHENTEYSAVGYVDDDGNPLVATRLLNMDNQRTADQGTGKSDSQEKVYGSMNVLQEAIARIEDIESKDSIPVKNNIVKTEKGTQAEERQDQQMDANYNASGLKKAAHLQVPGRQAVNSETDQVESDRSENMVVEIIDTTAEEFANVDLQTMGYNYECGVCELIFRHKCQVLMHMEEDHPEHKFPQCPTCNKVIIDDKNLREHVTIHDESKDFKCNICNKAFRTKQILRQHSHIHATEKPYSCNFCGHGFTQKGFYLEHIRRHTGVKPFKCSVCSKAFVSKNLLRIHMYSHANTRPFQCELCPKSFSENYQLNCHMRTHNEDRPFECTECDKAFFVRSKLIRHMNTVHGIDKEELSNYVATRVGDGVGYRDKTKVVNQDSKQTLAVQEDFTRVVYVDVHGNMVSQKIPVSVANKDDSQLSINPKPNTNFISISEEELTKSGGKFLQIANSFVNLENGLATSKRVGENMPPYEVVTRQDKMGNIKISDVRQVLPNSHAHEEIALSDSNSVELNGQSYTFVTQGEGEGQIAVITETLNDAETADDCEGQGQIQMITANDGMLTDSNQETMEVVSEAMMAHQVEGAANLSINIGEDGTLDPADFEKIEALQSMYGDQQIVIVLESKQQ